MLAIVNTKGNSLLSPKLTFSSFFPYVRIGVPLAAVNTMSESLLKLLNLDTGITEISAPLSTKNFNLLTLSNINRRRDKHSPV